MLYLIISVAYAFVNLLVASTVFLKSRGNFVSRFYGFCVVFLVSFGFLGYLLSQSIDPSLRRIAEWVVDFQFSLFPFMFLHYLINFLEGRKFLKFKLSIMAIYATGMFAFFMLQLGFIPKPFVSGNGLSLGGHVFYITWMSILFTLGVAQFYSLFWGLSDRGAKSNLVLGVFVLLSLVLPGPFSQSIVFSLFHEGEVWYIFSSVVALVAAVYLVFRHKTVVTLYDALKSVIAAVDDILIKTDENLRIEIVRGGIMKYLGFSERELVGRSLADMIDPKEYLQTYLSYTLRRKMKEGFFDAKIISKSGDRLTMNFSFAPVFVNEVLTGFVAVARDITDRKQAEEKVQRVNEELERRVIERTAELEAANRELRNEIIQRGEAEDALQKSEEKYRTLFEGSKDAVFISTPLGRFVDINPAGVVLFGYSSKEEILKSDIKDLYADLADREKFQTSIGANGFVKDFELILKRRDGQKITVLETTTAFFNEEGNIVQYRGMMRDVTKQRQLEKQLLQSQKMESLGTLAGGIAHDFNNVLAAIMAGADAIARRMNGDEKVKEYASIVKQASQRGSGLAKQLLAFARLGTYSMNPLSLNGVIRETVEILERTFAKSVEIQTRLPGNLPLIDGDSVQLQQVFMNLFVNARDAMPQKGRLTIETRATESYDEFPNRQNGLHPGEYVKIEIIDTGVGMDEETQKHIFEPFFTTKDRGQGTGLGLAMVYGIVQGHKGFINVESTVGVGTTFRIFFPVSRSQTEIRQETAETQVTGGSETILVVDDEEMIRSLSHDLLTDLGYQVVEAESGESALEIYRKMHRKIDLVVLDMAMPRLDGEDTYRYLRKINPSVKVIISSGLLDPAHRRRMEKNGISGFLQKPYELDEFAQAIRNALGVVPGMEISGG
jgi:PAS domain S-box-containing protein